MGRWNAAVVQMDVTAGEPPQNVEKALSLLDALAERPALAVLPELFSTGYPLERPQELAREASRTLDALAAWARARRCALSGSLLHPWPGGAANCGFFVDRDGTLQPLYAKAHLFRPMGEDAHLVAGRELRVWSTSLGRLGVGVCYDLRFPEMIRRLALSGAQVLLAPAQWPAPRTMHWEVLLRARAIENGLFALGANRVGAAGGLVFEGASQIVDPWGEVLVHGGAVEGVFAAEVRLERGEEARRRIPTLEDRVPEVDG